MAVNIGPRIGIEGEAEYRKQLNNIIQQTKTLHSEMRSMESAWNKDTSAKEKAAQQSKLLNQQIDTQKQKVEELKKGVEQSAAVYGESDTKTLKWKQALADAETELHRLQNELRQVPNQMQLLGQSMQEAGKKMQTVGKGISSVGSTLTKSVTAPVAALGVAAVKTTADFDSSMSKVMALSGASAEEFETLRAKAREMGAATKYSATEAADALSYMALAGWDTAQMAEGLDGVLNLAAASGMDLASASDLVTDYLSAFGLQASDSARMADELAYAQANSNTTTAQLGEAFGNTAAQMHTAGQSMETTTAILEAFANQGLKGSEAGTALSAMVRDITQKMKDGKIYIGETAVTVQDANGNFRNMIDILADVEAATDGMGSAEKSAALMTTFTARSVKGVSMALTEGSDNIRKYESDLGSAGGTAKEMAETMQDNLSGQLTILKSQVQELGISFGDILVPKIRSAVSWLQESVDKFNRLDKSTKENIVKFGLLAAAVGPVLSVTGKLVESTGKLVEAGGKAISWIGEMVAKHTANTAAAAADATATGTATVAQEGFNAAMHASPIGAVALAITGAVAAILALKAGYDKAKQSALEANEELNATVTATEKATDAMDEAAGSLKSAYDDANDSIGKVLSSSERATVLADDIAKLTKQESLNADEKARMQAMVQELNGLYPSLNVEIDENTGKTKQNAAEIKNLVSEAANMSKIEVYNKIVEESSDALAEAYKARAQASWEASKAEDEAAQSDMDRAAQIQKLQERIKSATDTEKENLQAQLNSRQANGAKTLAHIAAEDAIRAEEKAEKDLTAAIEEHEGFLQALQETLGPIDEEMAVYSEALNESSDALEAAGDGTQALIGDTGELADEMGDAADEISDYAQEIIDAYNSTAESAEQAVMDQKSMFEDLGETQGVEIEDMIAGLQSHVDAYANWNSNVESLMNSTRYQTDVGFRAMVNSVASAGLDMAPELQAIVRAFEQGDTQLETLVDGYGNLQQLSVEVGQNTATATTMLQYGLEDMNAAFVEGGILLEGAATGMIDAATQPLMSPKLPGAGVIIASETVNSMATTLDSAEPAAAVGRSLGYVEEQNEKFATKTGQRIASNLGTGMTETGEIASGGAAMNSEVSSVLTEAGLQSVDAQQSGSEIAKAMAQGINGSKPLIVAAMNAVKTSIQTSLLQVKSLSSTAKTNGKSISTSVGQGINEGKSLVVTAMSSLKSAVTTGLTGLDSTAKSAGSGVANSFAAGMSSGAGTVSTTASNLATNASTPLSNLQNHSTTWGNHLISNFITGMEQQRASLVREAVSLANEVSSRLKHSTPKEGPLKDDNIWGYHLGQNFAEGMERAIPVVEAASMQMASAAVLNPFVDADVLTGAVANAPLTMDDMFEAFSAALDNADLRVQIAGREFGRILRDYA